MSQPAATLSPLPNKPVAKPARPEFSSGPCVKRPGWTAEAVVARALLGRSHRAAAPKAQLKDVIDRTARVLGLPADYRVGIVPASDTGAFEMAMWSMLGARPVDMLAWESFGQGWAADATKQLKLDDCRVLNAPYGALSDLAAVRPEIALPQACEGERLAKASGGVYFPISQVAEIDRAYEDIARQLRAAYDITYRSELAEPDPNRPSPRLRIRVKRPNAQVRIDRVTDLNIR